jgi:hypothetical protein
MPVALSAIEDVAVRDWVTGETITPGKLAKDYRAIKDAVNLIIRFLREMEKRFASGEPIDKANGFLWYDAATALLKLYRSGAWEEVMTEETAGSTDIKAGGGTDTGKLGGPINVDTTETATFISYTLPANTIDSDSGAAISIAWGSKGTGAMTWILGLDIDTFAELGGTGDAGTKFISKYIIVRTGASAQKLFGVAKFASDALGYTSNIDIASAGDVDLTANADIELDVIGIPDPGIVDGFITSILP